MLPLDLAIIGLENKFSFFFFVVSGRFKKTPFGVTGGPNQRQASETNSLLEVVGQSRH